MAFKKREVKREKSIFCLFILLLFIFSSLDFCFAQECEQKVMDACPNVETQPLGKTAACLEKNRSAIPKECHDGFQEFLDAYYGAKESCGADYKKLCKLDIEKMTPQTQYGPAWEDCLMRQWNDFSEGCKDVFRGLPFFSEIEPGLEKISAHEKAKTRKKIRVRGTNQTVTSEYIDGNIVWYKARMKKKKVLERYEHCPVLDGKWGLKREINNIAGTCRYLPSKKVAWDDNLLKEIEDAGYFDDESLLKYRSLDNSGLRGEGRVKAEKKLVAIVEPYDVYCPEGFHIDVENYPGRKVKEVRCSKKNGYSCKQGFVSEEGGYELGCVRLASCKESSDKYESIGQKYDCGRCYAGGCIDHERSQDSMYPLCKVNYKKPDQTPCEEYRIRRFYYNDGKIHYETHYKVNHETKKITYDVNGNILRVKKFDHASRWNSKEYDGKGRLREETHEGANHKFYDEQGNIIDVDQLKVNTEPDPATGETVLYRFKFDQSGRPLKKYTYKTVLLVKEWVRDEEGNVIKVIDYDEQGNVINIENK